MKTYLLGARSVLFAICLAVVANENARAATHTVTFGFFFFNPNNLTVNVGDTVVWQSAPGGGSHTVTGTGSDAICGSGTLVSCSHTFNTPGSFPYECILPGHATAGMTGVVTVESAATNIPPSVTITNPVNGAVFAAPANVTLQPNASDTDGSVTNVEFFANSTSVGSAAANPFSLVASNLAAGNYALTAVATDNGGLSATSSPPVNISVVAPIDVMVSLPSITNGEFQFTYTANAGLRYVIEHSSNFVNWNAVVTNTASSSNETFGEVFDVNFLRFYRVGRLPNP